MAAVPSIIPVTALVDWNAQIHASRPPPEMTPARLAIFTLEYFCKTIGNTLSKIDRINRFDVVLRFYHGWHKGFEPTPNRKALVEAFASADFRVISQKSNVVIRPNLNFGDNLISAANTRLHVRLGCHLPNTLRRSDRSDEEAAEKMVDTAIASDLVDLAHGEKRRWLIVLADDDDLVPPAFVAEGVRSRADGRVILVRGRASTPFLKLDNLRVEPC